MATRGKRQIVRIVGDAYSAPRDARLHVSAKPIPVLKHFMTMLVDENTTLFDPTCGSGNALVAAEDLGASSVLGLEIDETQCGIARQALRASRSMRGLSHAI
jgi:predicted RNA methylase